MVKAQQSKPFKVFEVLKKCSKLSMRLRRFKWQNMITFFTSIGKFYKPMAELLIVPHEETGLPIMCLA